MRIHYDEPLVLSLDIHDHKSQAFKLLSKALYLVCPDGQDAYPKLDAIAFSGLNITDTNVIEWIGAGGCGDDYSILGSKFRDGSYLYVVIDETDGPREMVAVATTAKAATEVWGFELDDVQTSLVTASMRAQTIDDDVLRGIADSLTEEFVKSLGTKAIRFDKGFEILGPNAEAMVEVYGFLHG